MDKGLGMKLARLLALDMSLKEAAVTLDMPYTNATTILAGLRRKHGVKTNHGLLLKMNELKILYPKSNP